MCFHSPSGDDFPDPGKKGGKKRKGEKKKKFEGSISDVLNAVSTLSRCWAACCAIAARSCVVFTLESTRDRALSSPNGRPSGTTGTVRGTGYYGLNRVAAHTIVSVRGPGFSLKLCSLCVTSCALCMPLIDASAPCLLQQPARAPHLILGSRLPRTALCDYRNAAEDSV